MINGEKILAAPIRWAMVGGGQGSQIGYIHRSAALQNGTIRGAGLDVFENEPQVPEALMQCESAVLLPHLGSGTHETRAEMARLVVENLAAHFSGAALLTPVC